MQEGNRNLPYFAYGEHMNEEEMHRAFPAARMVGMSRLEGFALCFLGKDGSARPALEAREGQSVPGRVWSLPEKEGKALDAAVDCPRLKRREIYVLPIEGMKLPVLVYTTVPGQPKGRPSFVDYTLMQDAYKSAGEPTESLFKAASICAS